MPSSGLGIEYVACRSSQGRVVEIGAEARFGSGEEIRRQRRLMPAHHLRIEPSGVRRLGPGRAVAADQEVVGVGAEDRRRAQSASRPLNVRSMISGATAMRLGAGKECDDFVEIVRIVDEIGRAAERALPGV